MNDARRVLPCPFCGGPAKSHKQHDGIHGKIRGYYVCCNKRGCPIFASTRVRKTQEQAIEEWNHRPLKEENKSRSQSPEKKRGGCY